nr:MAG TPA: hypothetical protein [Bacteriophage sp.]
MILFHSCFSRLYILNRVSSFAISVLSYKIKFSPRETNLILTFIKIIFY